MLLDEEHYVAVEDAETDPAEDENQIEQQDDENKSDMDDNIIFKTSHKVTSIHQKLDQSLSESGSRNFLEVIESVEAGPLLDLHELAEMSFSEVQRVPSASKPPTQPKLPSSPGIFSASERFENNPFIKKSGLVSLAESFKAPDLNASADNHLVEGNVLESEDLESESENLEKQLSEAAEMIQNYQYSQAIPILEKLASTFEQSESKIEEAKARKLLSDALFQENVALF